MNNQDKIREAVNMIEEHWVNMRARSKQPMVSYIQDKRNDMDVFKLVLSLNNLHLQLSKDAKL